MIPAPPILHDLLRLFVAARGRTPRGIDRVDLAYARFLFSEWPGPCFGVVPTPRGTQLFERSRVLGGLDELERLWFEDGDPAADPVLAHVHACFRGQTVPACPPKRKLPARPRLRGVRAAAGFASGRGAVHGAPRGSIYLNIGQLGWAAPVTTRWLQHRPDIRPVFMMHDAIPVERRDLVSRSGHWAHRMMLHSVSQRAAGLITTTETAARSVLAALAARGHPPVPTLRLPLPVAPVFLSRPRPDPALAQACYFIVVGAIEPRKNLVMLLDVWRRLMHTSGEAAPFLVIAGAPAHRGGQIIQQLRAARSRIVVVNNLSSPALCSLMSHARALLMPSLAEGFGLPIIEALALGTPVLASALPAHMEAGGAAPSYLDPLDTAAWTAEIKALADGGPALDAARGRVAAYRPLTQAEYFRRAGAFLAQVALEAQAA
jgi:glycosyltransferase involved in cell wall biosynthesis